MTDTAESRVRAGGDGRTGLRLHDTAVGAVVAVEPRTPGQMAMYVCGLTPYDVPHVGHGRLALVFDVLRRHLEFCGFAVHHVSNITDIDDKIIARAAEEGRSPESLARQYEAVWWDVLEAMGVARPTEAPRATEWIEAMIDLVSRLLQAGVAYATGDGVYLAVDHVEGYGLLARQSLDSLRVGARVEVDEDKRSPFDFALWKAAVPGEPSWDAPFGAGRPGWHTECVVMSLGLLGEDFDLHGGGIDLAFPHHENERAQAVALGRRFARHWVHNGFVEVGGEKMSKSLNNFTSLEDLLARCDGRAYRLLVLRSHYRSPIEVTPPLIEDAERGLDRLDGVARRFGPLPSRSVRADEAAAVGADPAAVEVFVAHMDDDLDTPGALGVVYDLVKRAHIAADAGDDDEARRAACTVAVLCRALGLELSGLDPVPADVAALVAERDAARAAHDWSRADALRDELADGGWDVEDSPTGSVARRRPGVAGGP